MSCFNRIDLVVTPSYIGLSWLKYTPSFTISLKNKLTVLYTSDVSETKMIRFFDFSLIFQTEKYEIRRIYSNLFAQLALRTCNIYVFSTFIDHNLSETPFAIKV